MNVEFKPEEQGKIDPSSIKQQYAQINKEAEQQMQQPQMTEAEITKRRTEEEEKLDAVLPYLRKQFEATELEMKLTRMDCELGRINSNQIPGLLGKELQIRSMKVQQEWAHLTMAQQELLQKAMKEKEILEKLQKQEAEKGQTTNSEVNQIIKDAVDLQGNV